MIGVVELTEAWKNMPVSGMILHHEMTRILKRKDFARWQAGEKLPAGVQPQIGPVTTGLGEVVMYTVGYANPDGKGARRVAGQPGWQPDGSYLPAPHPCDGHSVQNALMSLYGG